MDINSSPSSAKKTKYHNRKVVYEGIKFDSERERDRYIFLKDQEGKGLISSLEVHPKYTLVPAVYHEEIIHLKTKDKVVQRCDQLAITYTADFRYRIGERLIVEDVKISKYMLPKEYLLKEKLLFYSHRIRIHRVYEATTPIL